VGGDDRGGGEAAEEGERAREKDQFPVDMRVLAVDDAPICLKLLKGLLRRCQYHGKFRIVLVFLGPAYDSPVAFPSLAVAATMAAQAFFLAIACYSRFSSPPPTSSLKRS
jgi:hypothetical protein